MPLVKDTDILFIINPHSGGRKATSIINQIAAIEPKISCLVTHDLNELKTAFQQNIEKYTVFIVAGGDGTVNEAVQYLIGRTDKIFGIFPAGSGNGFARELGFKKNLEALIEDAKKGESLEVDVLSVNEKNCINMAGLGFDSFVAHHFQQSKSRGLKNYMLSTLKSILIFKPFQAALHIDEKKMQGNFQMITVANTRQFGNNAIISPQSKPDDRIFELVLARPFPFYLYTNFVLRMFLGTLKESKYLSFIKVKKTIEIESDFKQYHIDGEPKTFDQKLTIRLLENRVRVLKTRNNLL